MSLCKEKAGASKDKKKNLKLCQLGFNLLSKIYMAKQLEQQKLPQPGKGHCLPWAAHGGRRVPKGSSYPKWPRRCMHVGHPCGGSEVFRLHRATKDDKQLFDDA